MIFTETLEDVEMGEFPDDAKLACYFKCVMETGGVVKSISCKLQSRHHDNYSQIIEILIFMISWRRVK